MRIALSIAGSDSGGGAGIQADLRTFHQFGVHGTTVVTAVTAQNTLGVSAWDTVRAVLVGQQLDAVATDLRPHAFKSGMLGTAEIIGVVADGIARYDLPKYVLDPVMVATSGDRLLDDDAAGLIRERLIPRALLVTPNLHEATILTGVDVRAVGDMARAGNEIIAMGAQAVLMKGGHLNAERLVDVLVTKSGVQRFEHPRLETKSTHGTGCVLSAAVTAGLASGRKLEEAVASAIAFVQRAIALAPKIGAGHGPLGLTVEAPKL